MEFLAYSIIPFLVPFAFILWTCRTIGRIANWINPRNNPDNDLIVSLDDDEEKEIDAVRVEQIKHAVQYWQEQVDLQIPGTAKHAKLMRKLESFQSKLNGE